MIDYLFDPLVGFASAVASVFIYVTLLAVRAHQEQSEIRPDIRRITEAEQETIVPSGEEKTGVEDTTAHLSKIPASFIETIIEPEPLPAPLSPVQISQPQPDQFISYSPQTTARAPIAKPELAPIKDRLQKTRASFFGTIAALFSGAPKLSADLIEEFQFLLVSADLGIKTTTRLIDGLKSSLAKGEEVDEEALIERLKVEISKSLVNANDKKSLELVAAGRIEPYICLVVGVNGVGKTTTTAKLASRLKSRGLSVMLVAADTFRAAAVEQLQTWGVRLDVPVVTGTEANAKPQTVVFEAMKKASSEKFDVILIDTAGRLNNKSNLMQELAGIKNAVERHFPAGVDDVLMVVDGTTGQNAVAQAKEFHSVVDLTGLIVTKLDGTPKGGVVVAVSEEINVPVQYIGVGEAAEDLRRFERDEFIDALFSREEKTMAGESAHAETRKRKRRAA